MKTAVITINYNNPDDTEKCLYSLRANNFNISHVVVIDNASNIGNIEEVIAKFKNVTLIKAQDNYGYGRANNIGIKWVLENTTAEYLLLLNNDAYVDENTILLLEAFLDNNPNVSACSPKIVFSDDPEFLWYGGGEIDWKKGGGRSWNIHKRFDGNVMPVDVTLIPGCAMMLRRDLLLKIGGFDQRFFLYCEDIELCARIVSRGERIAYVPAATVWHRCHGSIRHLSKKYVSDYEISYINPRLAFVLENIICNTLLTFHTYAHGMDKIYGAIFLIAKWGRNSTQYFLKGRFDGIAALFKGVLLYQKIKNTVFVDELRQGTGAIKYVISAR